MNQLASPMEGERGIKRKDLTEDEDESGSPKSDLSSSAYGLIDNQNHNEVGPPMAQVI